MCKPVINKALDSANRNKGELMNNLFLLSHEHKLVTCNYDVGEKEKKKINISDIFFFGLN